MACFWPLSARYFEPWSSVIFNAYSSAGCLQKRGVCKTRVDCMHIVLLYVPAYLGFGFVHFQYEIFHKMLLLGIFQQKPSTNKLNSYIVFLSILWTIMKISCNENFYIHKSYRLHFCRCENAWKREYFN